MASIGGLTNSTSGGVTGANGIRGYGGLASGLDRDTLIEQMTYATRAKIAKQQQKQTSLQWQQDAYRSVSDKLIALSEKFTSFSSSTNLYDSSFYGRSNVTAKGDNSKYVQVSGVGNSGSDSLSILGVKQLATNASRTSEKSVSDQILSSGGISAANDPESVSNIAGKYLTVKYGDKTYSVRFGSTSDYGATDKDIDQAVEQMNKDLENVNLSNGKKLSEVMQFEVQGGKITMKKADASDGNSLSLAGGDDQLLHDLGFLADGQKMADIEDPTQTFKITAGGLSPTENVTLWTDKTFSERVAGKTLNFTYNGKNTAIKIADDAASVKDVLVSIQNGLDKAYGKGRVVVGLSDKVDGKQSFQFVTTDPTRMPAGDVLNSDGTFKKDASGELLVNSALDQSSLIGVTSADSGLLGEYGAFHMKSGENNRLNLNDSLLNSGINLNGAAPSADDLLDIVINGVTVENITYGSTVSEIMEAINKTEGIGVQISYMANSDRFTMVATDEGASGKVNIGGSDAALLFGNSTEIPGQDAVVTIQYKGSGETVDITRGSNTFTQDGLNITVKGTFGTYDAAGNVVGGDPVEFESSVDTDKVYDAVKGFIEAYNEIVDLTNSLVGTKPDRKYPPLTDQQKSELSESQIEKWEAKAKEGILFNDSLLRGLSDELRSVTGGFNLIRLEEIGITVSSDYLDNGKISINESKFKAALSTDPEAVQKAFTEGVGAGGTATDGVMVKIKSITEKYASTIGATKGSLIERAGSTKSALSLTNNALYKQMKEIDDIIDKLNDRLKSEQDRYIKQFTTLETLVSQMNSQSSWLAQQFS